MKRTTLVVWLVWVAIAAAALWAITRAGTMQTCSTTNELVMLNPYTINTNTFVVSEGAVGDTTATVWTFVNGDATGPDATHLAPTLYPAAGRWVKNAGGSGGTNIFNTIIVTNLTVISNLTADTLWTNKAGVLQPTDLTLPVMLTNQLSFSKGMTNILKLDSTGVFLDYTNSATTTRFRVINGTGRQSWHGTDGGGWYLGTDGNLGALGVTGMSLYMNSSSLYPSVGDAFEVGSHDYNMQNVHERTNYVYGYHEVVVATNDVRVAQSMSGNLAVFNITAKTNNVDAPISGFSFRTNGVEVGWFGGSSNSFVRLAGDTMTGNLYAPNLVVLTNMTDTWNDVGTTFSAIKLNVTDSASAAGSMLLNLQKNNNTYLSVDKTGKLVSGKTGVVNGAVEVESTSGTTASMMASFGMMLASVTHICWDNYGAYLAGQPNTGISYDSPGVLRVNTDYNYTGVIPVYSPTNSGAILSRKVVQVKATNYVSAAFDVSKIFSNEGATGMVTNTLPAASSGLVYSFVVQDADGLTVQAVGDDTIRIAGSATGAAGNVSCTVIGNTLTIVAINATEWMALSHEGTWTVSAP